MTSAGERALIAAGALAGFAGVGLSALAAHVSGPGSLEVAARFLLVHAPALLALAALIRTAAIHRATALAAGAVLALGLVLFCGDLAWRVLLGPPPVPMAAPTGGVLLMLGWLAAGAAALAGGR